MAWIWVSIVAEISDDVRTVEHFAPADGTGTSRKLAGMTRNTAAHVPIRSRHVSSVTTITPKSLRERGILVRFDIQAMWEIAVTVRGTLPLRFLFAQRGAEG